MAEPMAYDPNKVDDPEDSTEHGEIGALVAKLNRQQSLNFELFGQLAGRIEPVLRPAEDDKRSEGITTAYMTDLGRQLEELFDSQQRLGTYLREIYERVEL